MIHEKKFGQAMALTLRELRGLRTQKEMAEKGGLPASTWCKIEQGRQIPREATIEKLAHACGRQADELQNLVLRNMLRLIDGDLGPGRPETSAGSPEGPIPGGSQSLPGPAPPGATLEERWSREGLDLEGLTPVSAHHVASALDTVAAVRRYIEILELNILSIGRNLPNRGESPNPEPASED